MPTRPCRQGNGYKLGKKVNNKAPVAPQIPVWRRAWQPSSQNMSHTVPFALRPGWSHASVSDHNQHRVPSTRSGDYDICNNRVFPITRTDQRFLVGPCVSAPFTSFLLPRGYHLHPPPFSFSSSYFALPLFSSVASPSAF